MRRAAIAFCTVLAGSAAAAEAQVSVYSVLGIGFPSRAVGTAARAQGDGIASIDAGSAVNPAAIALQPRLSVIGVTETTGRSYVAEGVSMDGLRDTRFPFFMLEGQVGTSPIIFGLSYSTYTDRSYHITAHDTVTIRGEDVPVLDELASDGGVADIRAAVAWDANPRLKLGVAFHLLAGSTREEISRVFDNANYAPVGQKGDVAYSAWGVSAGMVYTPLQRLRFGAAVRRDAKLEIKGALLPAIEVQLPTTLTAGFMFVPLGGLRWSVTGSWRSWSAATEDVPEGVSLTVFDTWTVGTGIEFRGNRGVLASLPVRLGVRYAPLPFSPKTDQAREIDIGGGSGVVFAGGRALFEFAVERAIRDGGGARERAWQIFLGLTLRP